MTKKWGWDVLSQIDTRQIPERLDQILMHCRGRTRELMLNQHKIAGLGNVYVNEILFLAGVSPLKSACRLNRVQRQAIWNSARDVLGRSMRAGGISVRNYYHPDGNRGAFQKQFMIYSKKNGSPCARCYGPIKVTRKFDRSIFWCPKCQR